MRIQGLTLLIGVFATSTPAFSQDSKTLHSARTFRCEFAVGVATNMDADTPLPKINSDKLELVFDQLDIRNGTGRFIGNVGGSDVTVVSSDQTLSIVERTMSGTLQVTVIYVSQLADGKFKAVHSRHTAVVGGVPLPSQVYGACQALF